MRDIMEMPARNSAMDAKWFRVGRFIVVVTGVDLKERWLQTARQIAWEKALGGDGVPA